MSKHFTVVMRGPAAFILWKDEFLNVNFEHEEFGNLSITYKTRWIKKSSSVEIPGHLWVEISGNGEALEKVLMPFANAALAPLVLLVVASNSAAEDLEVELAFESTKGVSKREYFQSYVHPELSQVHQARRVDINVANELMRAIVSNPESERIFRAANQYKLALKSWKLGNEILSLAHFWMAVEALTKVALQNEIIQKGCKNSTELAKLLGVDIKSLDATIRKSIIFKQDDDCYKKAKNASDGFEHGFLNYELMRVHAKDVRYKIANYVRESIISLSGVKKEIADILLSDAFLNPFGFGPITKYLRGHIIGETEILAKEGNSYPFIRWNPIVESCISNDRGEFDYKFKEDMSPEFNEGLGFELGSFEVWQPDK